MSETFYTVQEAAEMLKVKPITVYRAIWSGRLGHTRVGRTIRIAEGQLEEYLKAREVRG